MITTIINVIAFFLLAAALYLAYQAGEFRHQIKDSDDTPPVVVFPIVAALAAYLLLVFT
ncbi:hypothetical protein [Ruegeria sp. Ofav3-42]|uniref:hypothetical protein n=1 Tax=Ruegeria sp. Ofav3-42 TaxID=2917759 RepID=UPI001EF428DE|nr:hypothetical protein [Ruegeria sp. Ofav3-42]MCG7518262.1 hypothetical protein [Ruegeria sp. Ofav3-42]